MTIPGDDSPGGRHRRVRGEPGGSGLGRRRGGTAWGLERARERAPEHRDGRFGNIVVGVEEEEGSGTALQFALREAHVRSCRLTAVHAWNPSSRALTTRSAPSWYARYAMEAHRRLPSQVLGPARRALLDAAAKADLLVVCARRRQGHPGLQPGLINHALLHHAPCPVAVIPHL